MAKRSHKKGAGTRSHRRWTESENEVMRACYGIVETRHLMAVFGRSKSSLNEQAQRLKITDNKANPFTDEERATLVRMNKEGYTDRAIAATLDRHERVILRERQRLELPSNGRGEMAQKSREKVTKHRAEQRKSLARQYNLPESLSSTQVMIVVLLAHSGMLTRHEIAERMKISPGSMSCRHLPSLRSAGLIHYIKPTTGQRGAYMLSALAMDLLSQAGREEKDVCSGTGAPPREVHGGGTAGDLQQDPAAVRAVGELGHPHRH